MPSRTTSKWWVVYVLHSLKDQKSYIGITGNLDRRYAEHQQGEVFSTKGRRPLELIYFEGCLSKVDAQRRETYLKTTGGRRFLSKRLKSFKSSGF